MLHCSLSRHAVCFHGVPMPRKYISLGGWCGPALLLSKLGLRTESYPLDYARVTLDGVLHFIQNGFSDGFFPPGHPPYRPECVGIYVLFRGQHTAFAHFDLNSPDVQAAFAVKFDRFSQLLREAQAPVTFFRTVTARNPVDELRLAPDVERALRACHPQLDYRIVYMVHEQGLRARSVQLAPLSSRSTLWVLSYTENPTPKKERTLFDRVQQAYTDVVLHSIEEGHWPAQTGSVLAQSSLHHGLSAEEADLGRGVLFTDLALRPSQPTVSLSQLSLESFPWRCHDNLALIDGVASVGGTCTGVGSTRMIDVGQGSTREHPDAMSDTASAATRKACAYCGSTDYHFAGSPHRATRPFTEEEDQLLLVHLYHILTGSDKIAAVEQLALELHRGAFEVICRLQFLTSSSTKLMDYTDPEQP